MKHMGKIWGAFKSWQRTGRCGRITLPPYKPPGVMGMDVIQTRKTPTLHAKILLCSLYSVIVRVRVDLRRTVVGD